MWYNLNFNKGPSPLVHLTTKGHPFSDIVYFCNTLTVFLFVLSLSVFLQEIVRDRNTFRLYNTCVQLRWVTNRNGMLRWINTDAAPTHCILSNGELAARSAPVSRWIERCRGRVCAELSCKEWLSDETRPVLTSSRHLITTCELNCLQQWKSMNIWLHVEIYSRV